ncbi:Glycosyl hydrolases family 17 signature [Nakaseomyces glabratus]|nr:Glycosyl hydrolases family 17 signature [Nakaseomyces glabratus]KAH7593095.1 Glycosyl hydrolases family 17 signature [Nakaseomyces glabratus]KAH7602131.1 Glycosyl hydrolases family 17 signature [Nakaseomyces glabratus]KAH7613521.1 Glycosyl hydrolases family 17 signature [Nakaseomyces glabratus]KAJ9570050.1 Cell surface mannoprotein mp65 [Nakaseomyces glabratus]
MKFSTLITSALLGTAIAAPHAAHTHKEKRDVVTKTMHAVQTVVVGPDGTPVQKAEAINEQVVENAPQPTTQQQQQQQQQEASPAPAKSTTELAPASSPASSSSSSSSSNTKKPDTQVGGAGVKGITYTPYNADGTCKDASAVASDLAALSQYPTIRLYGTDCNQVENVFKAKASGQKLFLGVFDVSNIQGSVDAIKSAVNTYGSWDDVTTVSIGNELVNGGQASPAQVGQYVAAGRAALQAAGFNGPVVSVDTFIAVINNPELCQYSDYMAVNAHAYFDQYTKAQDAGSWLLQQIQRVWTACDGKKEVVITESGWPSKGQTLGVAVPSKQNQKDAVNSITAACGADTFLYNAFNDYWKADGPYGCEKYWGVLSDE